MGKRQRQRLRLAEDRATKRTRFRSDLIDLNEAAVRTDGTVTIKIISPGWGSRGHYYSAELLEKHGPAAFPIGTHMYMDHPTESDKFERPERTLRDLAATIASTPRWDANHPTGPGLFAEVQVLEAYRDFISEAAPFIGVSIRAAGTGHTGEAEGKTGTIVDSLEGLSVDFVTRAGRGGEVLSLLESAGIELEEAGTVGTRFEAAIHSDFTTRADDLYGGGRLTREERIALSNAVGDALAAFVAAVEQNAPQLYQRGWWDAPADPSNPTNPITPEESDMPMTEDEKKALFAEFKESAAQEAAATAQQLTEAQTAAAAEKARADRAEGALLIGAARTFATAEAAKVEGLPESVMLRVVESIATGTIPTVTVDNVVKLDESKLTETVTKAIDAEVKYLESVGVKVGGGQVTGAGGTTTVTGATKPVALDESKLDDQLRGTFGLAKPA